MKAYRTGLGYVSAVKKKLPNGKFCDWEYNRNADQAIELSPYWLRIFESDMNFVDAYYTLFVGGEFSLYN